MNMTTIAATHLFGSKDGYQTLASCGINSEEKEELSGLGFGQPMPSYFAQLLSHPTALGRRLESTGRYAVTRCFPGQKDDAGRATLKLLSLVIESKAWVECVRGNLDSLLVDPNVWDATKYALGRNVEIPYLGGQLKASKQDYLLVDHWVSIRKNSQSVVVLPQENKSVEAILHLAGALDPKDAPYYRWGIRMLSPTFSGINIMTVDSHGTTTSSERLHLLKLEHPFRNEGVQNSWKYRNAIKKTGLPNLACLSAIGKVVIDTPDKEPSAIAPPVVSRLSRLSRLLLSRQSRVLLYVIIIFELLLLLFHEYNPDSFDRFFSGTKITSSDQSPDMNSSDSQKKNDKPK